MPDIPGLAVWHDGHIGVYIGGGQVIEAMGTKYGVVKTELAEPWMDALAEDSVYQL
jgi:cell wall-associated NlpC family hydrolase